jgi:diguanylate cyclase (GGDEF)-like protein
VLLLALSLLFALRKRQESHRLAIQALSDELTRLPNRRALLALAEEALQRARRRGTPLALLMVDADHFKRINDEHGHATGDEVLRALAQRLSGSLRGGDRVGRLGGEEFVVLLPQADADLAQAIAERMRAAVAQAPLPTAAGPLAVTVSIGLAQLGPQAASVGALLAAADAALYQAKSAGRNRVAVAAVPSDAAAPAPAAQAATSAG